MRSDLLKKLKKLSAHLILLTAGVCLAAVGMAAHAFLGFTGLVGLGQGKSSECFLPNTHAILLEEAKGAEKLVQCLPISKETIDRSSTKELYAPIPSNSSLHITLKRSLPNAEERLKCLSHGKATIQCPGGPATELVLQPSHHFRPTQKSVSGQKWRMGAIKTNEIGLAAAELSHKNASKSPSFLLIEDDAQSEYVLMIGSGGEMALSSLATYFKEKLVALNDGENGYAIEVAVPKTFVDAQHPSPFYVKVISCPKILKPSQNKQQNTPCLYLHCVEGDLLESLPLVYDPTASGMRWPVRNGKYLLRYQPQTQPLAFSIDVAHWDCTHLGSESHTEACRAHLLVNDQAGARVGFQSSYTLKGGYHARLCTLPSDEKKAYLCLEKSHWATALLYPGIILAATGTFLLGRQRRKRFLE